MIEIEGNMKLPMLAVISFVLLTVNSCNDNPVDPLAGNQRPIVFSLTVFPDTIGPKDSIIVICNAMDPDGDTLVYDWFTGGRLQIKGANPNDHDLFHTYENFHVFYPNASIHLPVDTPWVSCEVRDGKGGGRSAGSVSVIVRQN